MFMDVIIDFTRAMQNVKHKLTNVILKYMHVEAWYVNTTCHAMGIARYIVQSP